MDAIVAAVITGSATLIGIFIIEAIYGKKTFNKLEKHDEVDSSGHQKLSNEHMELSLHTKNIFQLSQKIESKIETIDRTLFTEKEIKKNQIDSLSDNQKEIKNSLDKIVGFADEWERVSFQNSRLRSENEELLQENQVLRAENRNLRERISELEHDNEYER